MSTYLPKETGPGSVYSEGGGLYALGECCYVVVGVSSCSRKCLKSTNLTQYFQKKSLKTTTVLISPGRVLEFAVGGFGI